MDATNDAARREAVTTALDHLRSLVNNALELFEDRDSSIASVRKLKRALRIYQTASKSCLEEGYIPKELLRWIRHLSRIGGRRRTLQLVRFLADEADPNHVLVATQEWTLPVSGSSPRFPNSFEVELLPVLQTVLVRAAQRSAAGPANELSGALSKLRRTRQQLHQIDDEDSVDAASWESELLLAPNIWSRMATGMLPVLK
jgi:hypothetical protein